MIFASLLALSGVIVNASAVSADSTVPATSVGYDVSFPQCGASLPTPAGFGVVGVNDGRPFTANPCLVTELQWAQTTLTASPAFYANTANPGPSNNSAWPTSQQTPQVCSGGDSVACAYDWGWNAAQNSFQDAVTAETQLGASSPSAAAAAAPWWLDVETGNSWETLVTPGAPTSGEFANDLAVIQGEVASFTSSGVAKVGIYSTSYQWATLVGPTGSTFAANDAWVPGYATLAAAQAGCAAPSFTGGRVAMIQYPSNGLDGDYLCPLVSIPTSALVPVTSSATFTDQLTVAGESAPVTYVQTTGSPYLAVSSTGLITTSGPLASGPYTATGTSSANGLTGTFSFTLSVGLLAQNVPTTASAPVASSATFTDQLAVTGAVGAVTFTQSSGAPALVVSPTGLLTTSGALARGTYVARGATSDRGGDAGTFSFRLTVGTITQGLPIRTTVAPASSASFTDQLAVTGASGAVIFTQSSGAPALAVSPTGRLTTSGALALGSYVARGTTSDASGDAGTYFFNLIVSGVGAIVQSSPTTATVAPASSATFTDQLAVTGASGAVTFTQSSGAPALAVSPTGRLTTSGALALGSYVVQGATADASGDTGAFSFTLVVGTPARPTVVLPVATRVIGRAAAGRTVTLRILGSGFTGRPTVRSHAGTTAVVTRDAGTSLTVRVTVRPRSRRGTFIFTITLANRKSCRVRYLQV